MSMVQTDFASTSIVDKTIDFKKGGIKIHIDGPIVGLALSHQWRF